ncbi:hypothetical protein CPB86DRAFT_827197 [Serendipita vermifera]|nr:hypothetical protein CPB86DRAFT_827197 [Serendipita vermifera]
MPTATTTSKNAQSTLNSKSGPHDRKKGKVQKRRFGRVRREDDEDIVREARSDDGQSESENTDDADSLSESSAISLPDSHLPSSSQSRPTPVYSNGQTSTLSDVSEPGTSSGKHLLGVLQGSHLDWSDNVMATEGDVPEVQYHEMGDLDLSDHPRVPGEEEKSSGSLKPKRRGGSTFRRPVGMSARQVYLKRLENDPAYTPRVGEFWGHDERLLDKDLRSLSGWWRGKWTGREGGTSAADDHNRGSMARGKATINGGKGNRSPPHESVDPVDLAWKHDGFEEMQSVEERSPKFSRNGNEGAARGTFRGRGRGGGFAGRTSRSHSFTPQTQQSTEAPRRPYAHSRTQSMGWNRYEYAWTKHAVTFLFQDTLSKPKKGDEIGIRVKLPGQQKFNIIRISNKPVQKEENETPLSDRSAARSFIVKLPKVARDNNANDKVTPESVHTVASPPIPEQATKPTPFNLTQEVGGSAQPLVHVPPSSAPLTVPNTLEHVSQTPQMDSKIPEGVPVHSTPLQASAPVDSAPKPNPSVQLLTSLPTTAPSPAFSSPSYGPGYQFTLPRPTAIYPQHNLPNADTPVWYDPRMPYGYPTPPPLPGHQMYTPPPHVHHMHHHSMSHTPMTPQPMGPTPNFYPHPSLAMEYNRAAPPPADYSAPAHRQEAQQPPSSFTYGADGAMIDVQTGLPIFAPAKATTKIAIRKPGENNELGQNESKNLSGYPSSHETHGGNKSEANNGDHQDQKNENQLREGGVQLNPYSQPPPNMPVQMPMQPYMQGPVSGQVPQPFWNGYSQGQNPYYYPGAPYPIPSQNQDFGYGPPMQNPGSTMLSYRPVPYGEATEFPTPVYY